VKKKLRTAANSGYFCTTIYNFVLFAHSYFSYLLLLSPKFRGYVKFAERKRGKFGRAIASHTPVSKPKGRACESRRWVPPETRI